MNSTPTLQRTLGFWALTAYGVGDILGAGIYALIGEIAGRAGHAAPMAFFVTVVVAGLTALSYAELGGRFPHSGGEARFCQEAIGSDTLSLVIGFLVLASGITSLATVSWAFVGYLSEVAPALAPTQAAQAAMLIAFVSTLGGINFWGIRQSSTLNIVCTIVEAAGILTVIVVGLVFVARGAAPAEAPAEVASWSWLGIMKGSALAFFAFIGFEDMVNVSEEVERPGRNVPAAILTALGVAAVLYVIVAWVATVVVPPEQLAGSKAPLLKVVRTAAPSIPIWSFTLVALFAVANTGLLNFVMGSRVLYGMAGQGLLPASLHVVHPSTRTPHRTILLVLVAALVLALSGTLARLAGTTNILLLLVFSVVNVSLVVLKLRWRREMRSGFRVPILVPILGTVSCLALILFVPPESLFTAGLLLVCGLVLVGVWRWRRRGSSCGSSR